MAAPVIPTLIFRDTFTASDGTVISGRSPDTGSGWTFVSGYTGTIKVSSNAARAEAVSQSPAYSSPITTTANAYKVLLRLQMPPSFVSGYARLYFETTIDGATPYMCGLDVSSGAVAAFVQGAQYGANGDYFFDELPSAAAVSTTVDLELTVDGAAKKSWFYVDGVLVDYRVNTGAVPNAPTNITLYMNAAANLTNDVKVDLLEIYTGTPEYGLEASISASSTASLAQSDQTVVATGATPTTNFGFTNAPVAVKDIASDSTALAALLRSTSPHTDPLAAYSTWATALGLGAGTSLTTLDEGVYIRDFVTPILNGSAESRVMISSEGGIGLYRAVPATITATNTGITKPGGGLQTAITRFFMTASRPSIVLSAKVPTIDGGIWDGKWDTGSGAAIFYCIWSQWNTSGTNKVEAAFRFSANRVEVVVKSSTTNAKFQLFRFNETVASSLSTPGDGAITVDLPNGETQYYLSEFSPGWTPGFKATNFGRPEKTDPGFITDADTGARMLATLYKWAPADHASADAAYATWKTEFGITDSLLAGANTNTAININTDVPVLLSGTRTYLTASATGGFAFYTAAPASFSVAGYAITATLDAGQVAVADFWAYQRPSLLMPISSSIGEMTLVTGSGGTSAANDTTVVLFEWNNTTLTVEVAAKFQLGYLEMVVTVSGSGANPNLQVFRARQTNTTLEAYPSIGSYIDAMAVGGTYQYSSGSPPQTTYPTGFSTTQFGTPQFVGKVSGFQPTTFGTPYGSLSGLVTTFGEITQFGTPLTAVNAVGVSEGVLVTKFGAPNTFVVDGPTAWPMSVVAIGQLVTIFGTPIAGYLQVLSATGETPSTMFGSHASYSAYGVTGFLSTSLGTPVGRLVNVAAGFSSTALGSPARKSGRIAVGFSSTKFGRPRALRPTSWPAFGFSTTRFGRPVGDTGFYYQVTSSAPATQFGTPVARDIHKARHIPPNTMFGTPLLSRGAVC